MKKFFQKLFAGIKDFFADFRKKALTLAVPAINALKIVKEAINNPSVDVIVTLTANKVDDAILKTLRGIFKSLFPDVEVGKGAGLNPYIEHLRTLSPAIQDAAIAKAGSLMIKEIAKKDYPTITDSDADTLLQLAFKAMKSGAKI